MVIRASADPGGTTDRPDPGPLLSLTARTSLLLPILLGFLALAGWAFDVDLLKAGIPGRVSMNPVTALGFIVAGTSLWLAGRLPNSAVGAARTLALVVAALGALKLAHLALGFEPGPDHLLFPEKLAGNQMAPNTAFGFVLLGCALTLLHARRGALAAQGLALVTGGIALLALLGHAYGVRGLYAAPSYFPMALNTAVAFLGLSLVVLLARPEHGLAAVIVAETSGGVTARRLLPAGIVIPAAVGWLALRGRQAGLYGVEFGVSVTVISCIVLFALMVSWNARLLDRTERKRQAAEAAVRRHEAQLQAILDRAPGLIYLKDAGGRFLVVNRPLEELLGLEPEAILGRTDLEVLPPKLVEAFRDRDVEVLASGGTLDIEQSIPHDDGPRAYRSVRFALKDATGAPYAICGIHTDITERKRAAEVLEKYAEEISDLYQNAPCGYHSLDADGVVVRMNDTELSWLGYRREELIGKIKIFDLMTPESRKALADSPEGFARFKETGQAYDVEYDLIRKDGSVLPVSVIATSVRDAAGSYVMSRSVVSDITERKRAREEIQKLNQELERRVSELLAVNQELESFSHSVSHDLRAPLRHVSGFVDLLGRRISPTLDETGRHYLETITQAAARMGALIDDLLAFSRVGRAEMLRARVDLDQLVREVVRELEEQAPGRRLAWHLAPLPGIRGDPAMLRVVLVNLLSNAIKFTAPREEARIEVGAQPKDGSVIVFVRDNGVGFDMQYADKLFGVFQRLHRADEFEGTGVGLATVRRIIHRHGGATWAEAERDKGATFFFSLPRE